MSNILKVIEDYIKIAKKQAKEWGMPMVIGIGVRYGLKTIVVTQILNKKADQTIERMESSILQETINGLIDSKKRNPLFVEYSGRTAVIQDSTQKITISVALDCRSIVLDREYAKFIAITMAKHRF